MSTDTDLEFVVRTIAQTAVDNEKEFGDLDAVVGDGDFGYSLARGFEIVVADWDTFDRSDIVDLPARRSPLVISKRVGGTSGPIWGTAFLRAVCRRQGQGRARAGRRGRDAAGRRRGHQEARQLRPRRQDPAGRADPDDRRHRGGARRTASRQSAQTSPARPRPRRAAAEATTAMQAKRGRASYTGERSIGSPDAGAVAVAVMAERVADGLAGTD